MYNQLAVSKWIPRSGNEPVKPTTEYKSQTESYVRPISTPRMSKILILNLKILSSWVGRVRVRGMEYYIFINTLVTYLYLGFITKTIHSKRYRPAMMTRRLKMPLMSVITFNVWSVRWMEIIRKYTFTLMLIWQF